MGLAEIEDKLASRVSGKEHLWRDLLESPEAWQDFRSNKPSPRFPDVVRTGDEAGLWIHGYETPDWVETGLAEIEDKLG